MNYQIKLFFSFLFLVCILVGCKQETTPFQSVAPAMVVSISSDGQHVISSHRGRHIVLWDIKNKTKKIISTNGNIYSAYFIRNTDMFVWQDLENIVHIHNTNGDGIESFKHLATYGHVMSADLKHYFSSDIGWNLFYNYEENIKKIRQGFKEGPLAYSKLFNLTLSDGGKYLVTAGVGSIHPKLDPSIEEQSRTLYEDLRGVALWDVTTLKPIAKLTGNSAKTNATISPDGKFVVSGCENGLGYVWDSKTGNEAIELGSIFHGITIRIGDNVEDWQNDKTGLIKRPKDLDSHHGAILTTKFISDNSTYLQFLTSSPYAILYDVNNPLPIKYLPLDRSPFPSVHNYTRNASIDTAPAANILVTGQHSGGGINVYKYHPEKQELEKIWVAK